MGFGFAVYLGYDPGAQRRSREPRAQAESDPAARKPASTKTGHEASE